MTTLNLIKLSNDSSPTRSTSALNAGTTQPQKWFDHIARQNIITRENLEPFILSTGSGYIDDETSHSLCKKIQSSEVRVNFEGQFTENILTQGYRHWSQLSGTKNTDSPSLFIQRLESEFSLFGLNFYNNNVLQRAESLYLKDREVFISEWNTRFETAFTPDISMEALFQTTGFTFISDDFYYGSIFGCLYHNDEIITLDESTRDHIYTQSAYGKSQLILKQESLVGKTTYALGDTFDTYPDSYGWKSYGINAVSQERDIVLFEPSSAENIRNRLRSTPTDSLPYVEAHMHFKVTTDSINRLIISESEFPKITQFVDTFSRQFNIPIDIIE